MNRCLVATTLMAALWSAPAPAETQTWPTKQPVRIIVPLSPGSAIDLVARLVFDQDSRQIHQTIIIENRAGASQTIGTAAVAKSSPDGYTILVAGSALSVVPATIANLSFNVADDLAAVTQLASVPLVMVVSPSKGYKTVHDFVAHAKSNPGAVTYGSAGRGDSTHLAAERFRLSAKFQGLYVPFKGAPEVLNEVVAGRLDFYHAPAAAALPLIASGNLQPLGVASTKRASALPGIPTTIEAGFPDSDYEFWVGALVSAATPTAIVDRLHQEIVQALRTVSVQNQLKAMGGEPVSKTSRQFGDQIKSEIQMNTKLVKEAGLQN
jgi:tripartite-type tricarboxylate transporter receptor subunit TctC